MKRATFSIQELLRRARRAAYEGMEAREFICSFEYHNRAKASRAWYRANPEA